MKRVIEYQSLNPYCSDVTQTFISATWDGVDEQQYQFEDYLRMMAAPYNIPYKIKSMKNYDTDGKEVY